MKPKHLIPLIAIIAGLLGILTAPATTQSSFDCAAVTAIQQSECQALAAFYNATQGSNWWQNSGWLQTTTPCSWFGVTCANGDVSQLSLSHNLTTLNVNSSAATLTKFVEPATPVANGGILTYTLVFSNPEGSALQLFDPLSPTLAWQGFVGAPPAGITFSDGAVSGALTLSPAHPLTLSFTVRAQIPEAAFVERHAMVSNTAFFCITEGTACTLGPANTVSSTVVLPHTIFLPLVQVQKNGSEAEAIQVCDNADWCKYYARTDLQAALDFANLYPSHPMTLTLQPGVYTSTTFVDGIAQKDWMLGCEFLPYGTTFLLENRVAPTLIQGASGSPADVVILGGPTSWYPDNPDSRNAHALTLENDSAPVTLAHLTLLGNGGRSDRGLGGDTLNVLNSTGLLTHSIVAGNRTDANPLYQDWLHANPPMRINLDHEGVYLDGAKTDFDIINSLIAGNFHTGVMATENAQGRIIASVISGNGWNDWDPAEHSAFKGHGITVLGGSAFFNGCFLENSQLKIWNNLILHNSGNGVFLRGSLDNITTGVVHNTAALNANRGIWIDSLTLSNGGGLFIANNLVLTNTAGGIAVSDLVTGGVGSIQLYNNNSSHNLGPNFSPAGLDGAIGISTRQNNLELSNPLLDAIYRPLPDSQLIGAGWAMSTPDANPAPDISSYSYTLYPQYVFRPETLDLQCQLYTALGHIGAPTYPNPCP